MNDAKKSAIEKLAKMGLTEEEVLSLFVDDEEETIVEENGDSSEYEESKSWQQIVMEEHVGYYNKRYNVNLTFDEYYAYKGSEKEGEFYAFKQFREDNKHLVFRKFKNWGIGSMSFMLSEIKN